MIRLRAFYVRINGDEQTNKQKETKRNGTNGDTQKLDNKVRGVRGCFYTASSQSGTEATTGRKLRR